MRIIFQFKEVQNAIAISHFLLCVIPQASHFPPTSLATLYKYCAHFFSFAKIFFFKPRF